jgi:hypothetical protein
MDVFLELKEERAKVISTNLGSVSRACVVQMNNISIVPASDTHQYTRQGRILQRDAFIQTCFRILPSTSSSLRRDNHGSFEDSGLILACPGQETTSGSNME